MQEENNITFIENFEDELVNNNDNKEEQKIEMIEPTIKQNNTQDFIKELPSWDINPPLEINRGTK